MVLQHPVGGLAREKWHLDFFLQLLHQFLFLGKNASIVLWETMLLQVRVAPRLIVDDGGDEIT